MKITFGRRYVTYVPCEYYGQHGYQGAIVEADADEDGEPTLDHPIIIQWLHGTASNAALICRSKSIDVAADLKLPFYG
jgi:hypothetical protein